MRVLCFVVLLLVPVGAFAEEIPVDVMDWARGVVKTRLADAERAPEFAQGREWLNVSRPLTLGEDLAGKVVVLDFWCYCCINCIHVLPDLEYLEEKYAGKAFAVVGVHSAKFTNEKDTENIREAIRRYEIKHPVVNDGDFAIWKSYGARSWPTFAVITPDGKLLGTLSGEGNRQDLDALVAACLEHYGRIEGALDAKPLPLRPESGTRPSGPLAYPGKVAVAPDGKRLWIADSNHNRVVELDADGRFLRAFGDGERGLTDGPAKTARFFRPQGLTVYEGGLWVCDTENHALRRIDLAAGTVATVAGTGKKGNHARLFRMKGHGPWPAKTTALNSPWDILFVNGTGYIAMAGSHTLWTIDPKALSVSHFAGDGSERRLDGDNLLKAAFAQPSGLTWDGKHLYVADSESSAIVRVGLAGGVKTIAGGSTNPKDLFHYGDEDGVGLGRRFQHPLHVLFHGDKLYVADSYNHKIKVLHIATGEVTTLSDGYAEPGGLAAFDGRLFIADTNSHSIRTIDLVGKALTLKLKGVPIPQSHARRGGIPSAWPDLDTVTKPGIDVRVKTGVESRFGLRLKLPEGWKLTEGAPSMLRIEVGEHVLDTPIAGLETEVRVPALPAGKHKMVLRLLYYVCQDEGTCRVHSARYYDRLEAVEKNPGSRWTRLDYFEP